jgi:translation initiation factor 5
MATINITGTRPSDDPHYRYTMPPLSIHHEGRGNGQKTVLLNLKDVSNALDRPIELLVRYFGIELSVQSRQESETRVTINGTFTSSQLLDTLNKFIDTFVMCPNCNLPDTNLGIKKEQVRVICKACGAKEVIPDTHKLVKYIVKLFGK